MSNTRHKRSTEARRAAAVLDTLKSHRHFSDQKIADLVGTSRQSVVDRRTGRTAIDFDDVAAFAEAFEVPVTVFYMTQPDLLRWLADNGADLLSPRHQEICPTPLAA